MSRKLTELILNPDMVEKHKITQGHSILQVCLRRLEQGLQARICENVAPAQKDILRAQQASLKSALMIISNMLALLRDSGTITVETGRT